MCEEKFKCKTSLKKSKNYEKIEVETNSKHTKYKIFIYIWLNSFKKQN